MIEKRREGIYVLLAWTKVSSVHKCQGVTKELNPHYNYKALFESSSPWEKVQFSESRIRLEDVS